MTSLVVHFCSAPLAQHPIALDIPPKISKKDGECQEFSLPIDTGFDGEIALDAALLDRYNLATRPDHQLLTPEQALESDDNWNIKAPYAGKIESEGRERTVGI